MRGTIAFFFAAAGPHTILLLYSLGIRREGILFCFLRYWIIPLSVRLREESVHQVDATYVSSLRHYAYSYATGANFLNIWWLQKNKSFLFFLSFTWNQYYCNNIIFLWWRIYMKKRGASLILLKEKYEGFFLLTMRVLLISLEIGSMKCPNRGDAATANQLLCL